MFNCQVNSHEWGLNPDRLVVKVDFYYGWFETQETGHRKQDTGNRTQDAGHRTINYRPE